jgi:glycosyltransferase involved in cell wall biosynthesis
VRVLYFHQHFSTRGGSTGTRSYSMARALIERGHRVTMVCGSYGGADTGLTGPVVRGARRGRVDGIEVVELRLSYSNHDGFIRRTSTFVRFAMRSAWIAITEPCDLIFATSTPLTAGIPGIVGKLLRRRRFVFEVRDLWPELPKAMGVIRNPIVLALMAALEWCCYRCSDRCVGLAPGIVDGIARRGVPRDRIALIPNVADSEVFHPRVDPARHRGNATGIRAAFTGTHGIANGVNAILDAAAELQGRGDKHVRIELIGDGKLKPQLRERAVREGLANLIFVDPMPKAALAARLGELDVGLMVLANVPAFYYGTSPNKFFDYLACGLPVICNYPGWVSDLITEHDCGIAVPPDDPAAFADALQALASNMNQCERMGKNSVELAKRFDRETLANQFVDVLEFASH